jgi:Fe2+ transport system protein FeoA
MMPHGGDDSPASPAMPLALAGEGQIVTFLAITGGGGGLTHRLAEMGLTPGQSMEVINRGPGPFIVSVKGTRLVLGRGMVQRMLVRPK